MGDCLLSWEQEQDQGKVYMKYNVIRRVLTVVVVNVMTAVWRARLTYEPRSVSGGGAGLHIPLPRWTLAGPSYNL